MILKIQCCDLLVELFDDFEEEGGLAMFIPGGLEGGRAMAAQPELEPA